MVSLQVGSTPDFLALLEFEDYPRFHSFVLI